MMQMQHTKNINPERFELGTTAVYLFNFDNSKTSGLLKVNKEIYSIRDCYFI